MKSRRRRSAGRQLVEQSKRKHFAGRSRQKRSSCKRQQKIANRRQHSAGQQLVEQSRRKRFAGPSRQKHLSCRQLQTTASTRQRSVVRQLVEPSKQKRFAEQSRQKRSSCMQRQTTASTRRRFVVQQLVLQNRQKHFAEPSKRKPKQLERRPTTSMPKQRQSKRQLKQCWRRKKQRKRSRRICHSCRPHFVRWQDKRVFGHCHSCSERQRCITRRVSAHHSDLQSVVGGNSGGLTETLLDITRLAEGIDQVVEVKTVHPPVGGRSSDCGSRDLGNGSSEGLQIIGSGSSHGSSGQVGRGDRRGVNPSARGESVGDRSASSKTGIDLSTPAWRLVDHG